MLHAFSLSLTGWTTKAAAKSVHSNNGTLIMSEFYASPPLRQVSISKCGYEAFYTFTRRECVLQFYITSATTCWMNSKSYTRSVGSFFVERTQILFNKGRTRSRARGSESRGNLVPGADFHNDTITTNWCTYAG